MKRYRGHASSVVGGSSLLVIFGVLCLLVLSLLSLCTAQADQRLAENSAQRVASWYEADLEAQRIYARLRIGERVSSVTKQNSYYTFSVPVSQNQKLEVVLLKREDNWSVLRWQEVANAEINDEILPLWQGTAENGPG